MKIRAAIAALIVSFSVLSCASAAILTGTDATPGNSWTATLMFDPGVNFDTVEQFIITDTGAGPFDAPGMSGFTNGWLDGTTPNANYAKATGAASIGSDFTVHFDGDISNLVVVDFLAWEGGIGGTLVAAAKYSWINGTFVSFGEEVGGQYLFLEDPSGANYDRSFVGLVPEPATLVIWSFGVGCLVVRRRR